MKTKALTNNKMIKTFNKNKNYANYNKLGKILKKTILMITIYFCKWNKIQIYLNMFLYIKE